MPSLIERARERPAVIAFVVALVSMGGPFTIDTIYPAFAELREHFDVSSDATQQLISVYLGAFAMMSLVYGSLSDAVGRKQVMLWSLVVYLLACIGGALAQTFEQLLVCRLLQGLSSGGSTIVSRALVRDLFEGPAAQRLMSVVMMIFGIAPAVAPVVGGLILTGSDWRGIFWFLTILAVVLIGMVWLLLPESLPPERRQPLHVPQLTATLWGVLRMPVFASIAATGALLFGGSFLYIASADVIVVELLSLGSQDFWRLFVPLIGGMVVGSYLSGRLAGTLHPVRLISASAFASIAAGGINMGIAWMLHDSGTPLVLLGPSMVGLASAVSTPVLQLAAMDVAPHARGAAASLMTFVTLATNALMTGLLVPVIGESFLTIAVASWVMIAAGAALWWFVARKLFTAASAAGS